jgi:hypothetical protein
MTAKSTRTTRGRSPARCVERGGATTGGSFLPFHTPVRGYRYAARPPRAEHPDPGQAAGLRREEEHPADPWAVGVWVRAEDGVPWRIGYLERAVAARLGPRLDDGLDVAVTVTGWTPEPDGRWRRPVIRIEPDGSPGARRGSPEPGRGSVRAGTRRGR